jgi:hypothetical protein
MQPRRAALSAAAAGPLPKSRRQAPETGSGDRNGDGTHLELGHPNPGLAAAAGDPHAARSAVDQGAIQPAQRLGETVSQVCDERGSSGARIAA